MSLKYKMTDETITYGGRVLHRIEALKCFGLISTGELGGFIEAEHNLSHHRNAWVGGDAMVLEQAYVGGRATVKENATVEGQSQVIESADICGSAWISGNSIIGGWRSTSEIRALHRTCRQ